jgi:hypothetical protein
MVDRAPRPRNGLRWLVATMLLSVTTAHAQGLNVLDPSATRRASVRFLDGRNAVIDEGSGSLGVSRMVTNNGTLPAGFGVDVVSPEPRDFRILVDDAHSAEPEVLVTLTSHDATNARERSRLVVRARRTDDKSAYHTELLRLVGDQVDAEAAGVEGRTLRVALRDRVVAHYEFPGGSAEAALRVGRPGSEDGIDAARQARLNIHVMRVAGQGVPVIGDDDTSAVALMRDQVRVANTVWLQCHVTFGPEGETAVEVVDPPAASMLAIADGDGLPAAGNGVISLRVDDTTIADIATHKLATPQQTARAVADALVAAGFFPTVSTNPPTRYGAGSSADVLVRRRDGSLARLSAVVDKPISTDTRQRVVLGVVDLSDGLAEFDNMNARVGTLEERALVKSLSDDDDATIDLFVVNRFTQATRQGEAFIAQGRGSITNTVILDRQGLRHLDLAFTLAHEVGHVLLDDPLHPDNVGPDRPWLLMDADSSRGTVIGPKRLRAQDCARVRSVARSAKPPVLERLADD